MWWAPPPVLTSRPTVQRQTAGVLEVRGPPPEGSPWQKIADGVIEEIVELRRLGFRFITLADDSFYPVTLEDLAMATRRRDPTRLRQLEALRAERFDLMARLAQLPADLVFFTQITMEAAEDPAFLDAMRTVRIRGALVGIEAVTPEGLRTIHKDFNVAGEALVSRLRQFREHGVHVLGSFIFGLPSDRPDAGSRGPRPATRGPPLLCDRAFAVVLLRSRGEAR